MNVFFAACKRATIGAAGSVRRTKERIFIGRGRERERTDTGS
jgi:hypothetical protein